MSILYSPDPVKGLDNTGYILVVVTSCCNSWNITLPLLASLVSLRDPIHVVLIDDYSQDGSPELAAAMGIPVLTTGRMTGLTASMNRAWQYFTSYPQLQSMFILNNDVQVANDTFNRLHRCATHMPVSGKHQCTR